jgi:DNA-binding CsgD family transcriptional regulator/tetratricopeptide (TPR) repeat protein
MGIIAAMARVSSPVFVGRTTELDRLSQALERASDGRPSTRLVAGEAGIGKTRLVAEFVEQARARDAQVLIGDCLQLGETGLPYAPFVGALRQLLRSLPSDRLDELIGAGRAELAHLLPDLGPAAPFPEASGGTTNATAAQARLFEVVLGVLRRLADERTVVLVLEDLHWADSSTRDLLRFVVRNARDTRFLFVATYRSDELHRRHPLRPLLAELERLEDVDDIELGNFGEAELAAQLAGITGRPPTPEVVATILARSGGNPFFAEELIAAGHAGLALPRSLRDTLEDRVRQVGPTAQSVLQVASVAGAWIDHRLLAEVAALPEPVLTEAVREAVDSHLLLPTSPEESPGYRFRHELIQEVVYEELLPNERMRLHAAYANAIEARPELWSNDPAGTGAQLAHHWHLAHDPDRALPSSLRAARAAAAGFAFSEAQTLLERALELWPKVAPERLPRDVDRTVILEEAAEAAAQAGDPRRSIDFVRSALAETDAMADSRRAGVLHHRLAWYLNESGDWQAGVASLERAVELIPIDPPTPERARVLSDLAHSLMIRSRFTDSRALAEAALAISRATGARVAEARALVTLGLDLACRSDFDRGIPILRESYGLSVELGDPVAIFLGAVGLGWALDESAHHLEALELAREARERIRHLGAEARFGGQLASKASRALWELGRWDEAHALMDETIASGPTRYALRWLLSNRTRFHIHRGDLERARHDMLTYEALGERVVGPDPDLMDARRAELAIVAGEPVVARGIVREALDRIVEPDFDTDARQLLVIGLLAEADDADAGRSGGDRARVSAAIERADELEERMRRSMLRIGETVPVPAGVLLADGALAEALASRTRGGHDVDGWERAVALRRSLGRPFELATVLARLAEAQLRSGERDAAAATMGEAHAIAVTLNARPLRTRLEASARRARIGLAGVDTADDAADRLGLTPREREVLALLADGRSNRQIGEELYMAESTAGVHVSHILGKLGVTRRSEAAALAHRLGLFPTT